MSQAFFFGGFVGGDEETLLADVIQHLLEFLVGVFAFHQAHIHRGRGFFGYHILRLLANIGAAQPANIQRRKLQRLGKMLAAALRLGELQFALDVRVVIGHGRQRIFFSGVQRNDIVIKAIDQNFSVRGFHGSQQTRESEAGIGRPVSVVAAVQRANRSVGGELKTENPAIAEKIKGRPL